jgi:hypothetical protein
VSKALYLVENRIQQSLVFFGFSTRKPRPTASRLSPVYLADFLIWQIFYYEVLLDFLASGFVHSVNNILSYLNVTNLPIMN